MEITILHAIQKEEGRYAMPLMDEFKEERDAIKNGSFKDKVKYFWCYYKFHTIVTICVIGFAVILIHDIVSQKEDAFFAVMLNSAALDEEQTSAFRQNYADYAGIDTDEYDVLMDNTISFSSSGTDDFAANLNELTMSASQRLMVYTAAGELDVIIGNSEIFPNQANQGMFHDLRDILTEEQITKYEPYFYYVDQAYIDALDAAADNLSVTGEMDESLATPPDPGKPEEMEQPIPVAIYVTNCETLTDAYWFGGDYTALGVMVNAPNVDNALKFIDYVFDE